MPNYDAANMPDGRELIRTMGWEPLPFGCVGLLRSNTIRTTVVWSWLILIPWADTGAKPWIDGTHTFEESLKTEPKQREQILDHMRSLLDDRYGEVVGRRAADDLLERIFNEEA